ncbi:B-cell receptor CD22-like [Acanthochromis polyacanthus]|uniref:B-cell receptor CD22-like n=1 Tax=Acanthochromis polyacanthus TaxID=80966 RepID=UPI002233F59B|nr:B-cell receptor CD22-like [Acanthochromis polyacanthus]
MTCVNSCDGGNISSVFTWFKDGESINEGPVLYLTNISSTNSGNYMCSLKVHRGATSRVIHIDVEGGPKNTSVFIRPSVEGDDSSNLILTCSSHANPPVENYTWFKIVGDDVLDVGHQPVLFPGDGGCYFCCATNKHGSQNSSAVILNIKPYWATLPRAILVIAAVAVLLIATTVIAARRCSKKRMRTPKGDCEEDIKNTDYVNWLECDQSQDTDHCERVPAEIIYTTVYYHNRESNMEEQDSQKEVVIYSTVCREQQLNPSCIEPS